MPRLKRNLDTARGDASNNQPGASAAKRPHKSPQATFGGRQLQASGSAGIRTSSESREPLPPLAPIAASSASVIAPGSIVTKTPRLPNFGNTCFINASILYLYKALAGEIPDDLWYQAITPGLQQNMAISLINLLKHIDQCRSGVTQGQNAKQQTQKLVKSLIMACQDFAMECQDSAHRLNYPRPEHLVLTPLATTSEGERSGLLERMHELVVVPDGRNLERSVSLLQHDSQEFISTLMQCLKLESVPGYSLYGQKEMVTGNEQVRYGRESDIVQSSMTVLPTLTDNLQQAIVQFSDETRSENCVWEEGRVIASASGVQPQPLKAGPYQTQIQEKHWLAPGSKGLAVQLGSFRMVGDDFRDTVSYSHEEATALLTNGVDGILFPVDRDGRQKTPLRLSAVICHKGEQLNIGHYVMVEREGDNWYLHDDQCRTAQTLSCLGDAFGSGFAPYLLLFEKVSSADEFKPVTLLVEEPMDTEPPLQDDSQRLEEQEETQVESEQEEETQVEETTAVLQQPPTTEPAPIPTTLAEMRSDSRYWNFLQGYTTRTKPGYSIRANESTPGGIRARLPIPAIPWLRSDIVCWDDRLVGYLCELCDLDYAFKKRYTAEHRASNALKFIDPETDEYLDMCGRYLTELWKKKTGLTRVCKALRLDKVGIPQHPAFPPALWGTSQWSVDGTAILFDIACLSLASQVMNEPFPLLTEMVDAIASDKNTEALLIRLNRGYAKGVPGMEPPYEEAFKEQPDRWSMAHMLFMIKQHQGLIEERLGTALPPQWCFRDFDHLTLYRSNQPSYLDHFKDWFSARVMEVDNCHDLMRKCNAMLNEMPDVEGFPDRGCKAPWTLQRLYQVAAYFNIDLPGESGHYPDFIRAHVKESTRIDNIVKQLNMRAKLNSAMKPPNHPDLKPSHEWTDAYLRVLINIDDNVTDADRAGFPQAYKPIRADFLKVCRTSSPFYYQDLKALIQWTLTGDNIPPTLKGMTFSRLLHFLNESRSHFKPDDIPVPDNMDIHSDYRNQFPWTEEALEHFLLCAAIAQAPKRLHSKAEELFDNKITAESTMSVLVTALNRAKADFPAELQAVIKPEVLQTMGADNAWKQPLAKLAIALTLKKTPEEQQQFKTSTKMAKYCLSATDIERMCKTDVQIQIKRQFNL